MESAEKERGVDRTCSEDGSYELIQPININAQVLPGYEFRIQLTPNQAGDYSLWCNEFCSIGHHLMTGKIVVK